MPRRLPVGSRPSLELSADQSRIALAPALAKGDHRPGVRAPSAHEPQPGSGESCDGNPSPAGAGGRDARALRVGGGRHGRASRPRVHAQRRRPQDAGATSVAACTWTDDRLEHWCRTENVKVLKRRIAPPTLGTNRRDSPAAERNTIALAAPSIGTRLPDRKIDATHAESTRQARRSTVASTGRRAMHHGSVNPSWPFTSDSSARSATCRAMRRPASLSNR